MPFDPAVRMEVARTLGTINDSAAMEALLTQIAQEPDADVRAFLAEKISTSKASGPKATVP